MNRKSSNSRRRKSSSSTDGFISRSSSPLSSEADIRSRFRKSYGNDTSLGNLKGREEGFTTRQSASSLKSVDSSHDNVRHVGTVHMDLDGQQATKHKKHKSRGLFRRGKKNKTKKRKFARVASVLVVAFFVGVASIFGYGYIKARNIFQGDGEGAAALYDNVDPTQLAGEGDGRINFLLIGKGGPGHEAPDLTDTLLLASIDPIQDTASLVSVPRDLWVQDSNGYASKINAVYSNAKQAYFANQLITESVKQEAEDAGVNEIKSVVSEVLGIPVHYYVMIDFDSFERAIDTVGGVTVDVKERLVDYSVAWLLDGNPVVAEEGLQTFDGERALLYARSRKGSARGDFDRTERQREIIIGLQKKVLSLGTFSNPFKVIELMNTLGDGVRTDLNGLGEIKRLYEIGQEINSADIASVGLADPPNVLVETSTISGQSVVVPVEGLFEYQDINSYIRNNIKDSFLISEDAKIVILNGTSIEGLAANTKNELLSYGYNITEVGNAPTTDYTQNLLIDLGNENKYTKSYLQRRLNLTATSQTIEGLPTAEEADFVIILGTDEVIKTTE